MQTPKVQIVPNKVISNNSIHSFIKEKRRRRRGPYNSTNLDEYSSNKGNCFYPLEKKKTLRFPYARPKHKLNHISWPKFFFFLRNGDYTN